MTEKQPAERFSPATKIGASFDRIMEAAMAVPQAKTKKTSRPKKVATKRRK